MFILLNVLETVCKHNAKQQAGVLIYFLFLFFFSIKTGLLQGGKTSLMKLPPLKVYPFLLSHRGTYSVTVRKSSSLVETILDSISNVCIHRSLKHMKS